MSTEEESGVSRKAIKVRSTISGVAAMNHWLHTAPIDVDGAAGGTITMSSSCFLARRKLCLARLN